MRQSPTTTQSQAGLTLIEVLIAAALLGILTMFTAKAFDLYRYISRRGDIADALIRAKVDFLLMKNCDATVLSDAKDPVPACDFDPAETCPESNWMPLYSRAKDASGNYRMLIRQFVRDTPDPATGRIPIHSAYDKTVLFRAACRCCPTCSNGKGVVIEFKRLNAYQVTSAARGESLQQQWKSLFPTPLGCFVP